MQWLCALFFPKIIWIVCVIYSSLTGFKLTCLLGQCSMHVIGLTEDGTTTELERKKMSIMLVIPTVENDRRLKLECRWLDESFALAQNYAIKFSCVPHNNWSTRFVRLSTERADKYGRAACGPNTEIIIIIILNRHCNDDSDEGDDELITSESIEKMPCRMCWKMTRIYLQ